MEIICPHCGKKYHVPDSAVGRQARCGNPQCKHTFVVGASPSSGPPPAPAAPPPLPSADPWLGAARAAGPGVSPLDALLSAELPGAASGTVPGTPLAPLAPVAITRPRRQKNYKPLVFGFLGGAAVIGVIVGVYFLVRSVGGDGGAPAAVPAWAAPYIMDGAKGIGYVNAEKLRKSDAYRLIQKLADSPLARSGMAGVSANFSDFEKIDEVFFVGTHETGSLVVVRTREDMPLDQARGFLQNLAAPKPAFGKLPGWRAAAAPESKASDTKNAGSIQYVAAPGAFFAKTESRTYCIAEKEDSLKPLSERLAQKTGGKLESQLQQIMQHASGDHFFAATGLTKTGAASAVSGGPAEMIGSRPEWIAFGLSADSSLTVHGAAGFANTSDAENIRKKYDAAMSQMDSQRKQLDQIAAKINPEMAKQARQQMEKTMNLVRAFHLTQSGNTIRISGTWKVKDVEELFEGLAGMIPRRPI